MQPGQTKPKAKSEKFDLRKTKSEFIRLAKKSPAPTLLTLLTLVRTSVRNVDASLGVLAFAGEVRLGRVESSSEESLGQSGARGNFSEPDQSWAHSGNVPEAATSSTYDGLVLGTLDQKASVGMHVDPKIAHIGFVELYVVHEDGPAPERSEELVLAVLMGANQMRVVGGH